jgi:hypothetical protein
LIGNILGRNLCIKHAVEGKTEGRLEVKRERGRRRNQLLEYRKGKIGYWKLIEEALDRTP